MPNDPEQPYRETLEALKRRLNTVNNAIQRLVELSGDAESAKVPSEAEALRQALKDLIRGHALEVLRIRRSLEESELANQKLREKLEKKKS